MAVGCNSDHSSTAAQALELTIPHIDTIYEQRQLSLLYRNLHRQDSLLKYFAADMEISPTKAAPITNALNLQHKLPQNLLNACTPTTPCLLYTSPSPRD